ncbi:hypothetical protein M9H77_17463 [Catharanthus roseus]|uniref:Uncharacterized protein n=1 Tax=Catharanthus roseus TaxID=4058 RepID=A0ACC0B4L5_CATRO|nr:hypothetical protein M9H77_17463 [Catharanthus roseus]
MLEKKMGPEPFHKGCLLIPHPAIRAQDKTWSLRILSTKELRHNKVGNLERPFLKIGFSFIKRKNMIELAVLRGCTARPDPNVAVSVAIPILKNGKFMAVAGNTMPSKLAAKGFQKPKKVSRPDGCDDNDDSVPPVETRSKYVHQSPAALLYRICLNVNQLEKDKDVIAQAQAIAILEALPQQSFSVANALNAFLTDTMAFWRIQIEAAFALANTASEFPTGHKVHDINVLGKGYGCPSVCKSYMQNRDQMTFHDFQEYFVLEVML